MTASQASSRQFTALLRHGHPTDFYAPQQGRPWGFLGIEKPTLQLRNIAPATTAAARRSGYMARWWGAALPRFLLLYGALYAGFGVQSPYLPALLERRG